MVVKIDQNSAQLTEALTGGQARIIITTLQKFPFILDKVAELPSRRYAVVVDGAHSRLHFWRPEPQVAGLQRAGNRRPGV